MKYLILTALFVLSACGSTTNATIRPATPPARATPPTTGPILVQDAILQTYTHTPSQRFSIAYPADWDVLEQPNGVLFIEPANRAGYSVFISQTQIEDPNTYALQFVQDNFGASNTFQILSKTETTIQFKGDDTNLGPAVNELTFLPDGDDMFLVLITVVEDEWDEAAEDLREITASLTFSQPATPTPDSTEPDAPPLWLLYGHPSNHFGFLYPDNWQLTDDDRSVDLVQPEQQYRFSVQVIDAPGAGEDANIVETYTQEQVQLLGEQFETFEALPVTAYQAGQGSGYTADYLYQNEEGLAVAGSIIVTGIDDHLYHVSISAPAVLYDEALEWFNPMLQSFKVLPQVE